ncbi:MAG: hypothetical protein FWC23_01160 [Chitinispirillia bacterium]|nr:hypothetical protein [Chitinispirillia bacterium]MCL2267785.1 hypothetical protein [Chitinispirillia bacterium]
MKIPIKPETNILVKTVLAALVCCSPVLFASENITSYSSPVTANDFLKWGDTMWVATSGGLRLHNFKDTAAHEMFANSRIFPDLHLTSLCRDDDGNIWIGSRKGYLYRMTPRGRFTTYSNYKISDWGITSLYSHDGLIVVGTIKGVSLFDPVKGVAVRNAARIANFTNQRVNTIDVYGSMLLLGCEDGVAYLDSLDIVPLSQRNFYDPGIWKTGRTNPVKGVVRSGDTLSVQAFVRAGDTLSAHSTPAADFFGYVIAAADSGWLTHGGRRFPGARITPWGTIQKLFNEGDRRLWIGSLEGFYYSWAGEMGEGGLYFPPVQHRIEETGMTLRRASRVFSANDGNVWFLPMASHLNIQWHNGIYRFDGSRWHLYNNVTYRDQFGYVGDAAALGGAVWSDGSFWAGTSGGNVKHIDPVRNTVGQLAIGYADFRDIAYIRNSAGYIIWGKSDALARDSSGYLWVSIWGSDYGSLLCYDPRYDPVLSLEHEPMRARYRRFFTEAPYKVENITALNVDADGRIFAYDKENGLTIFSHDGNPLANGITINATFPNYGEVKAIVTGEDGTTYIAASNGLRRVARGAVRTEAVDSTLTNITSLAVRGSVLWLSTVTDGILRFDLNTNERRWINESSGLPSNEVLSIALDRAGGRLWIVTDEGISYLDVGRGRKAASRKELRAFPNVFSVGGSQRGAKHITFEGLEQRASVAVYTVNGALVAKADAQRFNEDEWRAIWTPRRGLAPGTYIAVAKPSGKRTKIILKP